MNKPTKQLGPIFADFLYEMKKSIHHKPIFQNKNAFTYVLKFQPLGSPLGEAFGKGFG